MLLKRVARICVRTFFRGLGSPVGEKKLETKKTSFGYACIKPIDHCKLDTVPLRGGRAATLQRTEMMPQNVCTKGSPQGGH